MFGWLRSKARDIIDPPPPLTERMRSLGFHWVRVRTQVPDCDGVPDYVESWHEACDVCGGNCGQCGTSLGMGLPASISHIVKATGMNTGNHAGLPGTRT